MTSSGAHQHHAIDYIELSVTDLTEAKRFYEQAFGWQFNDYGPNYAGIQHAGREIGGLCLDSTVSPGPHAGPLVVLYSRDLDATLRSVVDARGSVTKQPFDFPGGRRFHFADPSGNHLAAWSER